MPSLLSSRRQFIAASSAAALAGCAARRSSSAALRFWAMSYQGDYSPMLTAPFTRATGIEVDVQSIPWTAAHEKLLTAQAGGDLPDVLMLPANWVGEFAMIGALASVPSPLSPAVELRALADPWRYRGTDYAVPWSVEPMAQFFRTDILARAGFARPPADWMGWREMARAIKRQRPGQYACLILLNWPEALFTFLGQTGAPLLRDRATRGNFDSQAVREVFAFYRSLFDEGLAPVALSTEIQDPLAAFGQGYFALWPGGPTLLLDLHRRASEIPADRWAVAQMPGPRGPAPVPAGTVMLAVSAHARDPAAAWRLVRHLASAPSEMLFQRLIGSLPADSAARAAVAADPLVAPFAQAAARIARQPSIVEWDQVRTEVLLASERVVRGQETIDVALRLVDQRIDAILAKRRALVEAGRIA